MDRPGADPMRVVQEMRSKLKTNAIPLQLPIGFGEGFKGVIDLVTMHAVYFEGDWGKTSAASLFPWSIPNRRAWPETHC